MSSPFSFLPRLLASSFLFASLASPAARAASATWSASPANGNWEASGAESNWTSGAGLFPGDTSGATTNADVATFLSSTTTSIAINATSPNASALNLGGITFGVSGSVPSSFTIGSTGGNALGFSNGAVTQIVSGITGANVTETINAPLVLQPASATTAGGATFRNDSSTASNILALHGAITGGATSNTVTLTLRGGNTGANLVDGLISKGGATTFAVTKSDGGTWILANAANSYNGNTTISAGILQAQDATTYAAGDRTLTGGGAMGTGQVVINGGTLQLRVNGDNTSAAQALTYQNSSVFLNGATTSVIDVDRVSGGSAQNKTLAFTATSMSRGGKLTVTGGDGYQLQLGNLNLSGTGDGSSTLNPTSANVLLTGTVNNNTNSTTSTLILDGTTQGNVVSAAMINGVGTARVFALTKSGTSTWTLTGANTYTGNTVVSAGTLLVNGTHAAGTGTYSVASGGTLGGSGSITAASLAVAAGGKLAPGGNGAAATLAFSLTGGMDLSASSNDTGAYLFDLGPAGASDKITLAAGTLSLGTLDFADFTFTALSGFGAGTYVLFDAASSISATLGTTSGTINGAAATLSLDGVNNDIVLTVAPEPSSLALMAGALLALVGASRLSRRTVGLS